MRAKRHFLIPLMLVLVFGVILSACGEDTATTTSTAPASTSQSTSPSETTAATAPPSSEQPAQTLKIGVANSVTGFLSTWMLLEQKYLELYADFVNKSGGITVQGQKYNIELVLADTQSSVEGAASAANKLVYDEKVKFVIGGMVFENSAINPICEQNKVMHLMFNQVPDPGVFGPNTPYTFVGLGGIVENGAAMLTALRQEFPEVKTIVFGTNDDGSQDAVVGGLAVPLAKLGFTVLNDGKAVVYAPDMQDMTPVANQINSLKPDSVMTLLSPVPLVTNIAKGLRALGSMAPFVCQAFPADIGGFIDAIGTTGATNVLSLATLRDDPNSPPKWKEFEAVVPPDGPISFTMAADLDILLQVMQKADSLEPDAVKAAWESTESMEGLFGTTYFGGEKVHGLKGHALSAQVQYVKIMDGKVVPLTNNWLAYDPIP